jgi:hypothetical protein
VIVSTNAIPVIAVVGINLVDATFGGFDFLMVVARSFPMILD